MTYNQIERIYSLCEQVMRKPKHVTIDTEAITATSRLIKKVEPSIAQQAMENFAPSRVVMYELMANAVNYSYWYGYDTVRPNDACANSMYELLSDTFACNSSLDHRFLVERFTQNLSTERFPRSGERARHLREIGDLSMQTLSSFCEDVARSGAGRSSDGLLDCLEKLICLFPGYGDDAFLKRAVLFFMQLHRRRGWWPAEIHQLHVPADYQIPRSLHVLGVLKYSLALSHKIKASRPIERQSGEEVEIRAASILACRNLAISAGLTTQDVDWFLWSNRDQFKVEPFHLTVTTDY